MGLGNIQGNFAAEIGDVVTEATSCCEIPGLKLERCWSDELDGDGLAEGAVHLERLGRPDDGRHLHLAVVAVTGDTPVPTLDDGGVVANDTPREGGTVEVKALDSLGRTLQRGLHTEHAVVQAMRQHAVVVGEECNSSLPVGRTGHHVADGRHTHEGDHAQLSGEQHRVAVELVTESARRAEEGLVDLPRGEVHYISFLCCYARISYIILL